MFQKPFVMPVAELIAAECSENTQSAVISMLMEEPVAGDRTNVSNVQLLKNPVVIQQQLKVQLDP